MTLAPQQTVEVDLGALRAAAASRTDLDSVSVQIGNSGAPGSLIGAAYSSDNLTDLTYDVPLRDYGKVRNDTGSYPWRIDNDYSTVVSITNAGTQPARFQVEIRYSGGPYSIKPRQLEPGQTAVFDLRKIRDEEAPDRTGKALAIDRGQFHWSVVATPGEAHLIGRAEVVSRSTRVASSYSCPTCCPDSGPFGGFDPHSYSVYVDRLEQIGSNGGYADCYGNWYPTNIWWSSLSTWDSAVATFATGTEELHGEGAGLTYGNGTFDVTEWWTDNMDCYQHYYPAQDYADVDVPSLDLHFSRVSYSNVSTSFSNGAFSDEASLSLGNASGSTSICTGSAFTMAIEFTFPPGGTMHDRNDPRNRIITGANHQYEWIAWNFNDIDSAAGSGSMDLRVFRKVPHYPIDYVDVVLTGNNPSGTIGTFAGKGRIHLVCP